MRTWPAGRTCRYGAGGRVPWLLLQGEQRGGSWDKSASQGVLASLSQQSPFVYPVLRVGSKGFV